MKRKRQILYQICGVFLGISCMLSACHEKEETFTRVAAAQEKADTGESVKKEDLSKDAKEPDVEERNPDGEEKKTGSIWVYICGEVVSPGVYELKDGDRITHAIEAAGGLTEEAGEVYLNQAAHLTDGQKIYVPSREEEQSLEVELPSTDESTQSAQDTGKININTATKEELLSLNGIGESRAEAILSYRKDGGRFETIEDLKKVDGIKDGIFQKIREQITVE